MNCLTKKKLQTIIADVFKAAGQSKAAKFLDDIKELGFQMAYKGGLSMGLNDVKVPEEKEKLVANAQEEVDGVWNNYMMGLITDNERYNQVIDIWTRTNTLSYQYADETIGRRSARLQLDLHDDALRGPWFKRANSSVGWYAGFDG